MTKDSSRHFPIGSSHDAPLIGRQQVFDRIWHDLNKPTPDNLSIVGPRFIGKTVLLKELAKRRQDENFSLVVYWELAYDSPSSNVDFIEAFCNRLIEALDDSNSLQRECREELMHSKEYDSLKEVLDELNRDEQRLLVVFDGFDTPLNQGLLTGQLFGQIRSLFYGRIHSLVTATRSTNTELARNQEVETSPLWNILQQIRLEAFDASDVQAAVESSTVSLASDGLKEIQAWTGNHPILFLSLLNHLMTVDGVCDQATVNRVAERAKDSLSAISVQIWNDCRLEIQDGYRKVLKQESLPSNQLNERVLRYLTARGLVVQQSGLVSDSCRFIAEVAEEKQNSVDAISEHFRDWSSYKEKIRTLLELRLNQLPIIDNRLRKFVARGLEDIPDDPDDCLNNLTSIEDGAYDLIWKFEFGSDIVPESILNYWSEPARKYDRQVQQLVDSDGGKISKERYRQLGLLQRLTGSHQDFESRSRHVSKDTYVLLSAIHQFRNRSQHADGEAIDVGVAVSALLLCIELLGCLAREFELTRRRSFRPFGKLLDIVRTSIC